MPATLHPIAARRPLQGWEPDAIRRRVARDFAAGHQVRLRETARQLRALAAEIENGEHSELVLCRAAELIGLRNRGQR